MASFTDFPAVWNTVLQLIKEGDTPMPRIPYPAIELSDDEKDAIRGDIACATGMPLTECLLKPSHVRLLYRITGLNRKEEADRVISPSNLLEAFRLLESTSDKVGGYSLNVADVINDKSIKVYSESGAFVLIRQAKYVLEDCLGIICTPKRYELRLATREMFEESRHYYDRNIKKSGSRALQLWRVAHTRFLLGDDEAFVDKTQEQIIEYGNAKYKHVVLGHPDNTKKSIANTRPPRHLL